jgi:hypothetical protein
MTGAQFWSYLQQKIDKAYSAYLDNAKANALIKEAMSRLVDRYWHNLSFEIEADELVGFQLKDKTFTPVGGVYILNANISAVPPANEIPYYMHMMRVLGNFEQNLTVTASGTTLTSVNHPLRKGSTVRFGATTYTVSKVDGNTFQAKDSGGNFATSAGTYVYFYDREIRQMSSTRKGGSFHKANIVTPRYEFINNGASQNRMLRVTPTATSITVDYIRTPPYTIDVANNVILLTDYYSQKFLYYLMDECALSFAASTHDYQAKQSASQDIINNP